MSRNNPTAFSTHRPLNLEVKENNTIKYGNKSLRCLGLHIWNPLLNQIKKQTTLSSRNLLTIGLTLSVNAIYVFFDLSTGTSILYYQYNLGFGN